MTPMPPRPGAVAIAAMVSVSAAVFTGSGRQGAFSIRRVITHCWAIDSTLLTSQ